MMYVKDKHYSTNLERGIIGACLLEREAFGRVYPLIESQCFYHAGHQVIYETLKNMYVNGIPIDLFTVNDHLQRVQGYKEIHRTNTNYFITRLTQDVVNSSHLEYHAHLVKTMWMEREIIHLTTAGTKEGDTRQKIQDIQAKLMDLQQKSTTNDWADMSQLMVDLYRHQDEMRKTEGVGLSTGIKEIDKYNGGFHPGQMIVIGARPSVGKSAFAGTIALHAARQAKKVGIISLEMSNVEIAARLAAMDTDTDFNVLFRGLYHDEKQSRDIYQKIGNETSTLPIFVTDKTDVNVVEIRSKADKLKAIHGLDMLIIDYLQLINVPEMANRNRENEIARVSRYTKIMAKEMNIPVVLLCQLNRNSTARKGDDRYPVLSDLRESGSIEQDADVVMFLHRDWMVGIEEDEDGNSTEYQADLVVRKWRNGRNNFIIPFDFDGPKMKFIPRGNKPFNSAGNWHPIESGEDKE